LRTLTSHRTFENEEKKIMMIASKNSHHLRCIIGRAWTPSSLFANLALVVEVVRLLACVTSSKPLMGTMLLAAAIAGTASVLATSKANAQYYPWCSIYNDKGSRNCGFVSFEQCMVNVHGIGGACELNPWAVRPGLRAYSQTKRRR
jgi:hypothetical protein